VDNATTPQLSSNTIHLKHPRGFTGKVEQGGGEAGRKRVKSHRSPCLSASLLEFLLNVPTR
jgi:hypothetical protein